MNKKEIIKTTEQQPNSKNNIKKIKNEKEAWNLTLKKWKTLSKKKLPEKEIEKCAFCDFYNHKDCPVSFRDGGCRLGCYLTPYPIWVNEKTKENALKVYEYLLFLRNNPKLIEILKKIISMIREIIRYEDCIINTFIDDIPYENTIEKIFVISIKANMDLDKCFLLLDKLEKEAGKIIQQIKNKKERKETNSKFVIEVLDTKGRCC